MNPNTPKILALSAVKDIATITVGTFIVGASGVKPDTQYIRDTTASVADSVQNFPLTGGFSQQVVEGIGNFSASHPNPTIATAGLVAYQLANYGGGISLPSWAKRKPVVNQANPGKSTLSSVLSGKLSAKKDSANKTTTQKTVGADLEIDPSRVREA